jgi:hypothetical protein
MSDVSDPTNFVIIMDATPAADNQWFYIQVPQPVGTPAGYHYVAFRQINPSSAYYWIDDVEIISPEPPTPPIVNTIAADALAPTSATLHKTVTIGSEPIDGEGFRYKSATGSWIDIGTTANSVNITNLTPSTAYEFFAYATTVSGTVSGDTLSFTTLAPVGVDTANANEFVIYPNPATDIATVKVEGLNASAKVTVTDINGKLIQTLIINAGNDNVELDVAGYADGTYLVRVVSDSINRVEKLIVKK